MKSFVLLFDHKPKFEIICNYLKSSLNLALPLKPKADSGINSVTVVLHDEDFNRLNDIVLKELMYEIVMFSYGQVRVNSYGCFDDDFLAIHNY